MTEEAAAVPFAVALRRRVGRQTGNAGRDHRNDEIACDLNVRFTTVPIEVGGQPCLSSLRLVEDEQSQHWGGHVCGGLTTLFVNAAAVAKARVLADHLLGSPERFAGKRVVELGAGTGLVGLALAAAGAEVVLTDQAAGLPILERNAELNAEALRAASCQPPTVHKLTWGGDVGDLRPPVDVVVCSDCIYMATSIAPLVQTIRSLSDAHTKIWVGHQHRSPEVERLFREKAMAMGLVIKKEGEVHDSERYGNVRFNILRLQVPDNVRTSATSAHRIDM